MKYGVPCVVRDTVTVALKEILTQEIERVVRQLDNIKTTLGSGPGNPRE